MVSNIKVRMFAFIFSVIFKYFVFQFFLSKILHLFFCSVCFRQKLMYQLDDMEIFRKTIFSRRKRIFNFVAFKMCNNKMPAIKRNLHFWWIIIANTLFCTCFFSCSLFLLSVCVQCGTVLINEQWCVCVCVCKGFLMKNLIFFLLYSINNGWCGCFYYILREI